MAQFYTLEESAQRMGLSLEEFKRRLKLEWTSIRPFRDGATLRFRAADIDELARTLGVASDPGLQLDPGSPPLHGPDHDSDNFTLTLADSDTNHPKAEGADSSSALSFKTSPSSGDSDVRLDPAGNPLNKATPESNQQTEEINLDLGGPGSAIIKSTGNSSGKLSAGNSGTRLNNPESSKIPSPSSSKPDSGSPDSSSEFELNLDSDSDSFELELPSTDSSDEVDLGSLEEPINRGNQSGINLGKPSDSGVSLEKKGPKTGPIPAAAGQDNVTDDSDADFELSLDDSPVDSPAIQPITGAGKTNLDSDSEFELTLDDSSGIVESLANDLEAADENKRDIFETDFELPSMDESGSEVVPVDEADDEAGFEVDVDDVGVDDDSASQVVLVDDDDVEPLIEEDDEAPVRGRGNRAAVLDDEDSASAALVGVHSEDDDYRGGATRVETVIQTPPKWGMLPAIVLFPCLFIMLLGSLMSYEAIRGMWGYHQPAKPGNLLVRGLADSLGMKTND